MWRRAEDVHQLGGQKQLIFENVCPNFLFHCVRFTVLFACQMWTPCKQAIIIKAPSLMFRQQNLMTFLWMSRWKIALVLWFFFFQLIFNALIIVHSHWHIWRCHYALFSFVNGSYYSQSIFRNVRKITSQYLHSNTFAVLNSWTRMWTHTSQLSMGEICAWCDCVKKEWQQPVFEAL